MTIATGTKQFTTIATHHIVLDEARGIALCGLRLIVNPDVAWSPSDTGWSDLHPHDRCRKCEARLSATQEP